MSWYLIYQLMLVETLFMTALGAALKRAFFLFDAGWGCVILFTMALINPGYSEGFPWLFMVAAMYLWYWSYMLLYDEVKAGAHTRTVRLAKWLMEGKDEK